MTFLIDDSGRAAGALLAVAARVGFASARRAKLANTEPGMEQTAMTTAKTNGSTKKTATARLIACEGLDRQALREHRAERRRWGEDGDGIEVVLYPVVLFEERDDDVPVAVATWQIDGGDLDAFHGELDAMVRRFAK
jgi:hypothetical protein